MGSIGKWNKLYPIMKQAEAIASRLPWNAIGGDDSSVPDMQSILKDVWKDNGIKFDNETVSVALEPGNDGNSSLFVAPRYFRGIGLDEELPAFIEFTDIIEKQMSLYLIIQELDMSLQFCIHNL